MPRRTIEARGGIWTVSNSGRITPYTKDEFSLLFTRVDGAASEQRVSRYSPLGSKNRESALAELSDQALRDLLQFSQPAWTSAELRDRR